MRTRICKSLQMPGQGRVQVKSGQLAGRDEMRIKAGFTATRHAKHGFGSDEHYVKHEATGLRPGRLHDQRNPRWIRRDARFLEEFPTCAGG